MDILWLAVRITFRLIIGVFQVAFWMAQHAAPGMTHVGEEMSRNVNMRWYPVPFGNLVIEMGAAWFILTALLTTFIGSSGGLSIIGIAIGIILLPVFIGFGLGFRKQEHTIDAPPPLDANTHVQMAEQFPTIDSLDDPTPRTRRVTAAMPAENPSPRTVHPLPGGDPLDPDR